MIRQQSQWVPAAIVLFGIWLFLTVSVLLAGGPWLLPTGIIGGALIVGLPIVLILRAVPAQQRSVAAANDAAAKEIEQLNEYERAGFQVRQRFGRGYVVSGVLAGIAFRHYRTQGGRGYPPSMVVAIATKA